MATETELTPDELETAVAALTVLLPAGLGENADNKYVAAYLSQEFGQRRAGQRQDAQHAEDRRRPQADGRGPDALLVDVHGLLTTQTHDCVVDEDVAVDKRDRFQVVMSTTPSRPSNAIEKCGFTWLSWGPEPKHIAIMRNMLPAKRFRHSVQAAKLDHEEEAMGPYYPRVKYFATPEAFEKKYGC